MISPGESVPSASASGDGRPGAAETGRFAARGRRLRPLPGGAALLVIGVALVAFNMRTAVSSVPPVLGHFGLSGGGQSLLTTIPVLAFGAGAFAGPALRDRAGEEGAIFALLLTLLCGVLARAVWTDWALFPATLLAGLAIASLNVLLPSLVKRRFPQRAAAVMAAYPSVMTIGSALAAATTVPVLHASSLYWALGVWAAPMLLALGVWLPQLHRAGRGVVRDGRRPPISLRRTPLAWQVMLTMGLNSLIFYGELSWLPTIYRDRGLSDARAGLLLSVLSLVGLVGNIGAPLIAARLPTQRPVVVAIVVLNATGVLGVLLAPTATALIWVAVLGVGQGASLSLALLLIVLRTADSDVSARLSSMAQSGGYLIAALGPLLMGLVHEATGSWTPPLILLLGFTLAFLPAGLAAARNLAIQRDGSVQPGPPRRGASAGLGTGGPGTGG